MMKMAREGVTMITAQTESRSFCGDGRGEFGHGKMDCWILGLVGMDVMVIQCTMDLSQRRTSFENRSLLNPSEIAT